MALQSVATPNTQVSTRLLVVNGVAHVADDHRSRKISVHVPQIGEGDGNTIDSGTPGDYGIKSFRLTASVGYIESGTLDPFFVGSEYESLFVLRDLNDYHVNVDPLGTDGSMNLSELAGDVSVDPVAPTYRY